MTHRYIRLIAVTLAIMAFSAPIFFCKGVTVWLRNLIGGDVPLVVEI